MDAFVLGGGGSYLGTVFTGILYGAHFVTYLVFLAVYRYRGKNPLVGVLNIAVTCQFIFCTAMAAVSTADVYLLLTIQFQSESTLAVVGPALSAASTVLVAVIDFVTQASLIYRALIIWERRYIIIAVPSLLALASFGTNLTFVGILESNPNLELANRATNAFLSSLCISMALNFMIVSIIVTRILVLSRKFKALHGTNTDATYNIVISMLLESGVTVFLAQLLIVVLYRTNSPGLTLFSNPVVQIYGMTPTIILTRVALGSSYDGESRASAPMAFANRPNETSRTNTVSVGWGMRSQSEIKTYHDGKSASNVHEAFKKQATSSDQESQ